MIPFFNYIFFFFNDTATTEISPLPLHDALPIYGARRGSHRPPAASARTGVVRSLQRSEEHTSELQSLAYLVCRLLLEKTYRRQLTIRGAAINIKKQVPRNSPRIR